MVDLTVRGLSWCQYHGHPIMRLQDREGTHAFWITLAPEDAQLFSPIQRQYGAGRLRLYELLEAMVAWAGIRLTAVDLSIGDDAVLSATISYSGPSGTSRRAVHAVDAVILAWRRGIPLQIDAHELERICDMELELPRATRDASAHADAGHATPEPFRQFIESLDFGVMDEPGFEE